MNASMKLHLRLVVIVAALLAWILSVRSAAGADRLVPGAPMALEAVADQKLEQQLASIFRRIEAFQDIRVQVDDGVVTLGGQAAAPAAAEQAVDLAARFEGVVYVTDAIEVDTELDSRLTPAWRKIARTADNAVAFLPLTGVALVILAALYLLGRLLTAWEWPYRRFRDRILLKNLVRQLIRYACVLAGVLIGLEILGLTALIGAVLGAAGLFGLALGFAFKDIVENYVAGFLLSIRSPFGFRDWIAVDGHEGSVVRVTSRELVLITLQGNHIRIPNARVFSSVVTNFTRNPLRRFDIDVGVGVAEDLSDVQRIGCGVLGAMKGVAADPAPTMRTKAFGASTMEVVFSGWVDQREADFLKVRSEAVRMLKEALEQAGVDVPYPIQTVLSTEDRRPGSEAARKSATQDDIRQEAERADVARDSHLDKQIERDRQTSDDVDLLAGKP